ncbi:hypothetical protein BSKO_10025 [Bryopsis sp. KO-2023]|nr:hypothetical protein BSKO_10025 [Bryopsis sp. KO-2023]
MDQELFQALGHLLSRDLSHYSQAEVASFFVRTPDAIRHLTENPVSRPPDTRLGSFFPIEQTVQASTSSSFVQTAKTHIQAPGSYYRKRSGWVTPPTSFRVPSRSRRSSRFQLTTSAAFPRTWASNARSIEKEEEEEEGEADVPTIRRPPSPLQSRSDGSRLGSLGALADRAEWAKIREKYVAKGAISQVRSGSEVTHVSHGFLIDKRDEQGTVCGKRLCVDLRPLNAHTGDYSVRYETLESVSQILRPSDYMIKFDFADAFHHVGVHDASRKNFGFCLDGTIYTSNSLPFGFKGSPREYCELIQNFVNFVRDPSIVDHLDSQGPRDYIYQFWARYRSRVDRVRLSWYLDDFLACHSDPGELEVFGELLQGLLWQLGLECKSSKCHWQPSQVMQHLGLVIDTNRSLFILPPHRLRKVRRLAAATRVKALQGQRRIPARDLARFAGLAASTARAVPTARFHLREIYKCLQGRRSWAAFVQVSRLALQALRFWANLTPSQSQHCVWRIPTSGVLATDASTSGVDSPVPSRPGASPSSPQPVPGQIRRHSSPPSVELAVDCLRESDWLPALVTSGFAPFWSDLADDVGAQRAAALLHQRFDALADSSQKGLQGKFLRFALFCRSEGFVLFPPSEPVICAYIHALRESGSVSAASAPQYLAAISTVNQLLGFDVSVFSPMVSSLLTGWSKQVVRVDAVRGVPADVFLQVLGHLTPDVALSVWRDSLLSFSLFLFFGRSCSGTGVTITDLYIEEPDSLFFRERYTKTPRNGAAEQRLRLRSLPCPQPVLDVFRFYFQQRRVAWEQTSADDPRFLWLLPDDTASTPCSAVFVRRCFNAFVARFRDVFPAGDWTSHALRKGGATGALLAGVPLWKIRSWGNWAPQSKAVWRYLDLNAPSSLGGDSLFAGLKSTTAELVVDSALA